VVFSVALYFTTRQVVVFNGFNIKSNIFSDHIVCLFLLIIIFNIYTNYLKSVETHKINN